MAGVGSGLAVSISFKNFYAKIASEELDKITSNETSVGIGEDLCDMGIAHTLTKYYGNHHQGDYFQRCVHKPNENSSEWHTGPVVPLRRDQTRGVFLSSAKPSYRYSCPGRSSFTRRGFAYFDCPEGNKNYEYMVKWQVLALYDSSNIALVDWEGNVVYLKLSQLIPALHFHYESDLDTAEELHCWNYEREAEEAARKKEAKKVSSCQAPPPMSPEPQAPFKRKLSREEPPPSFNIDEEEEEEEKEEKEKKPGGEKEEKKLPGEKEEGELSEGGGDSGVGELTAAMAKLELGKKKQKKLPFPNANRFDDNQKWRLLSYRDYFEAARARAAKYNTPLNEESALPDYAHNIFTRVLRGDKIRWHELRFGDPEHGEHYKFNFAYFRKVRASYPADISTPDCTGLVGRHHDLYSFLYLDTCSKKKKGESLLVNRSDAPKGLYDDSDDNESLFDSDDDDDDSDEVDVGDIISTVAGNAAGALATATVLGVAGSFH